MLTINKAFFLPFGMDLDAHRKRTRLLFFRWKSCDMLSMNKEYNMIN